MLTGSDPSPSESQLTSPLHMLRRTSIAIETDAGTFTPYGLEFTGTPEARAILQEVNALLAIAQVTESIRDGS